MGGLHRQVCHREGVTTGSQGVVEVRGAAAGVGLGGQLLAGQSRELACRCRGGEERCLRAPKRGRAQLFNAGGHK